MPIVHLRIPYESNLAEFLAKQVLFDANAINQLLELGAIYVNGNRCMEDRLVQMGDHIRVHTSPRRFVNADRAKNWIVDQCEGAWIINKPAPLPVHATLDNAKENVLHYLSQDLCERLWITHRLDIETQGLMLVARSANAQTRLNKMIQSHQVRRRYRALVYGRPACGLLRHFMKKHPRAPKLLQDRPAKGWLECELRIRQSCQITERISEVEIELLTGRTHQIRAQLSFIGSPVVGDTLYGAPLARGLALQAFWLAVPEKNQARVFEIPRVWSAKDLDICRPL